MQRLSLQLLVMVTILTFSISGTAQQTTNPPQGNQQQREGQQPRTNQPNNTNRETGDQRQGLANQMTPQSFVQQVAESNQKEIEIARLATTRAEFNAVKDFARQLVNDHSKALDALRTYATSKNMSVPALSRSETLSTRPGQGDNPPANRGTTPGGTMPEMDQLSSKSGKDFDKAFIDMMVQNHEKGVALFEQQNRAKLGDTDLQRYITQTLPTLRQHLSKAKDLQKSLGR